MKKIILLLILLNTISFGQDLTGVRICIDPGHGGHESDDRFMPATGFWESESNLTKGLELRSILLGLNAEVAITRTGNSDVADDPGLSERAGIANAFNADFFNSNHSNGFNGTANYAMVIFNGTTNNPTFDLAKTMSDLMAPIIHNNNITTSSISIGDLTLNPSWTYGYGVLVPANMPATISEGSFHDYIPESWRLMNLTYRRHEARSLARSYLQYFGEPGFPEGAIAGIIRDPEQGVDYYSLGSLHDQYAPINQIEVTIEPGGLRYYGGDNNNGYFCRDSLTPGEYQVIATATGYTSDTSMVTVSANTTTFANFYLSDVAPPMVIASHPENGDTTFPAWNIPYVDFSKAMDATTLEAALSITPAIPGSFYLTQDQKRMAFIPTDTIAYLTDFVMSIAGTALDAYGRPLDGNQDGIGGDGWSIWFRTSPPDNTPPTVVNTYPVTGDDAVDLRPIFNIVWDEELESSVISDDMVVLERIYDLQIQETILEHHIIDNRSVLILYAMSDLLDDEPYRVRVFPGFEDLFGNTQNNGTLIAFTTSNFDYSITNIDDFDSDPLSNWWDIKSSGSSVGFVTNETATSVSTDITVLSEESEASLKLDYGWDPEAGSWLLRQYLLQGPPRGVHFNANSVMQAYVFGDGHGNRFRFCVDDNITGGGAHEVSPWYTIDWVGWRLISWDMSVDGTGVWIGDGSLDGTLEFDSIQLTYTPGQPTAGSYFVDELRVVNRNFLAIEDKLTQHPLEFALLPNYPNPFNPWTSVPFTLPEKTTVNVKVYNLRGELITNLISGSLEAGHHVTRWNASSVASGLYLIQLETNDISITRKVTVLK